MNYKPVRDCLLINLDRETEKTSEAGIFLPKDAWYDTKSTCEVVAVGDDVTDFKVGDRLLINPYAVLDIQGEKDLKLIKECDVLAYVG